MATYVDQLVAFVSSDPQARRVGARNGHRWCHLVADTSRELMLFAARIGLRAEWLQVSPLDGFMHFDLTPSRREAAVSAGAIEITTREIVALRRKFRAGRAA